MLPKNMNNIIRTRHYELTFYFTCNTSVFTQSKVKLNLETVIPSHLFQVIFWINALINDMQINRSK